MRKLISQLYQVDDTTNLNTLQSCSYNLPKYYDNIAIIQFQPLGRMT